MNETIKLMTVDEVADKLRRSPSQLRWMIHQGTAPKSAKIGGRRFFKETEVEKFIEEAFAETAA